MCLAMLLAFNKELPSNFIFCKLGRPSINLIEKRNLQNIDIACKYVDRNKTDSLILVIFYAKQLLFQSL
jgi:hypothetical protein